MRDRFLPGIPRGVAVLNTSDNKALRDGILGNPDVSMISVDDDWSDIQPDEATFNWSYLENTIAAIAQYPDKSVLLRINTMGGSQTNGGHTPDWVFVAMDEDPASFEADAGVTYAFTDSDQVAHCIPVFWQSIYLAKKRALLAMAGAHFANNTAIKIVAVSYANAITEDWNIPHDTTGSPSQVELWLNQSDDDIPGAGYTTGKMIDAAIHQADATFDDGVITHGTVLSSASAVFTQADISCKVAGQGYRDGTTIKTWLSPTQVILSQAASRKATRFTIVGRRDGLIDVAMAAFPNQYITGAVNGNGPDLDADCSDKDPGTCLAETVDEMAQATYPGRYLVQRNNVSAIIPTADEEDGSDAWILLTEAADLGMPVAGQALGVCWSNQTSTYRMNGYNNCDHDNPECTPDENNLCYGDCALSYGDILQRSADRLSTYGASYYEIYPPDASNLKDIVSYIHDLLDPNGGDK